ncbi:winged helix-turn-helix transcriptional regulator [Pandoraea apista]|uniref:Transcriptional regulator n=1 Tax=Pandoraea apista TaxID=93218 RepID=A0ABX9ZJ77_9BURK|nr:helix-turn-helix domain-containing protein [Pandoraea apista]PTE00510.1 transcriptional regulator [Pandoraea apista]RRJ27924.1 transcriptional regulator [Pandoraea apista]RRJ79630.1 transcriptional regulator [Pandoraea apista]RSD07535.1 transcriptional regulator [Pandoraea apista]RSD17969.1 transcriptional regulator [Pandoraea apista]
MQRKTFRDMQCPIARSLERVGEWWSILILREASYGTTRFDDFQRRLDIAPNMLTRRLSALVEEGLLARRQYCDRPPRFEYVLTDAGRDFRPVLWALLAWGNRHFAPEGVSAQLVDRETGAIVEPVVVDAVTGERLDPRRHIPVAGPAANEGTRKRLARAAAFATGEPFDEEVTPEVAEAGADPAAAPAGR